MYHQNYENIFCSEDEYFEKDFENLNEFIYDMEQETNFCNDKGKSTEQDESEEKIIPKMDENDKLNIKITDYDEITNEKETFTIKIEEKPKTLLKNKTEINNGKNNLNCNLYLDENLRRKCKHLVLDSLLIFINKKICEFYNNRIGKGICIKQLQALNQKTKSSSNINFSKELLIKTIGEIFSDNISGRITNFIPEHNKRLIKKLLNEENINISNYFTQLFKLTFFQCLEHYRGTKYYPELKEMKVFTDDIKNLPEEENYLNILDYYLKNYEKIINNKKPRNSKKM